MFDEIRETMYLDCKIRLITPMRGIKWITAVYNCATTGQDVVA